MTALKKAFDFFLFSSFYISLCAVLMAYQTYHLLLSSRPSLPLLFFVFYSTVCSYNFHWYLTAQSAASRRVVWTQHHKPLHLFLYLIGLSGSVFYFFIKGTLAGRIFRCFGNFSLFGAKNPANLFSGFEKICFWKDHFPGFCVDVCHYHTAHCRFRLALENAIHAICNKQVFTGVCYLYFV